MDNIYRIDISEKKEFTFDGDTLKQKYCYDEDKHIYVYERYNHRGRLFGYELVRGVRHKNPDGSIVYLYPCSEQFGTYGYFISAQFAETDIPKHLAKLAAKGSKSLAVKGNSSEMV